MINQGNDVPDNTIAVFVETREGFSADRLPNILAEIPKTRDWFTSHFYRCLPLTIANSYGFIIKAEYDFYVHWDGREEAEGLTFRPGNEVKNPSELFPTIYSHFGSGILTVTPPFFLRTPPGVNLMTINPPNFFHPNFTVMTGVVETDNLRRNFTFNIKMQMPFIEVYVPKGTPLAGFIPIPRYYVDSFDLVEASSIFTKEVIEEEIQAQRDDIDNTEKEHISKHGVGRLYFNGQDIYGNKFPDHQKTVRKK